MGDPQIHLLAGNHSSRRDGVASRMASNILLQVISGLLSSVLPQHLVELRLPVPPRSSSHRSAAFAVTQILENLHALVILGVTAVELHHSAAYFITQHMYKVVIGPRCSQTLVELELEGIHCSKIDLGCSNLTVVSLSEKEQEFGLCALILPESVQSFDYHGRSLFSQQAKSCLKGLHRLSKVRLAFCGVNLDQLDVMDKLRRFG